MTATKELKKFALTDADRAAVMQDKYEIDARAIMSCARRDNQGEGSVFYAVCNTFTKNYGSALSLEAVRLYVSAELNGSPFETDVLQAALTKMARAGYLRSYMFNGARRYEIAY